MRLHSRLLGVRTHGAVELVAQGVEDKALPGSQAFFHPLRASVQVIKRQGGNIRQRSMRSQAKTKNIKISNAPTLRYAPTLNITPVTV
jgi:hypothetical protein